MQTETTVHEIVGLGVAVVGLAMLAFIIAKGDKTAKVINAAGDAFIGSIRAATGQGKGGFA